MKNPTPKVRLNYGIYFVHTPKLLWGNLPHTYAHFIPSKYFIKIVINKCFSIRGQGLHPEHVVHTINQEFKASNNKVIPTERHSRCVCPSLFSCSSEGQYQFKTPPVALRLINMERGSLLILIPQSVHRLLLAPSRWSLLASLTDLSTDIISLMSQSVFPPHKNGRDSFSKLCSGSAKSQRTKTNPINTGSNITAIHLHFCLLQ